MNPTITKIDFAKLARQNIKSLSIIEKEIFDFTINMGKIVPKQPKYWDIKEDGTTPVFLR